MILIRYGELHLKGRNRGFFESALIKNIKARLVGFKCNFEVKRARYIVSDYEIDRESELIATLTKVFGIHSVSVAHYVPSDIDLICKKAVELSRDFGTFKVDTNRADKKFPLTSVEISKKVGGAILSVKHNLEVDLFNPDFVVNIDVREDGGTFVYADKILGAGGMPTGTAGKGLLLLSGGIDSPVACHMMAKRGLRIDAVHFHSYPYTSELAKEKVINLAKILTKYTNKIHLLCVPFTKIQEEIHKNCDQSYMVTLVRCFMMRIAERIALERKCGCLINGESLGQVASQTMESINVTNSQVKQLPIFRPCIGMDKEEIISIAHKIGTYETSILPYEDCCTVFLPPSPVIKPDPQKVVSELEKLDVTALINEAVEKAEVIIVK